MVIRDENWWREECNYISGVTSDTGGVEPGFNNDAHCFIRYCQMQRDTATRDGFHDAAQYIQHCVDDIYEGMTK